MEHIGQYVKVALKSKLDIDKIMKKLGRILKTKGIRSVLIYLKNMPRRTTKQKQEYEKLLTYISNNEIRMNYPEYLKSIHGLKNMFKLRTASMSGYWNEVQKAIRAA